MELLDRRPLAAQVRDRIWDSIQDGQLRPGDQLPSEQDLVNRFGVSRSTVREALKLLEEERLVFCRHGIGRFVAPGPGGVLSEGIERLQSVTEMADSLGIAISTHVLAVREALPDRAVQRHLGLDPGMSAVTLERVRLAQGEPIIYSVDIFARSLVRGDLEPANLGGSLLSVMENEWDAWLAYSKAVISAVTLDEELSNRIGVPDCVPWVLLEQVNYDAQDQPVLYSKDYHRGDRFRFHVLRRRR